MTLRTTVDRAQIPEEALDICQRLEAHGHGAWVVGGCVRDHLMGREVADWDICTSASPQQVMKIFPKVIPTGVQHGTVTVLVAKTGYEVTTLRGETTYSDGRRPDSVYFVADVREDLARRDFTVNAIAFDPVRGLLIDPFDGIADLRAHLIRAVGNPNERFAEDGLRVLRAARFVATLEFDLDPATRDAIRPNLATFQKVSAERVRDEWVKALKAKRPSRAFEVMRETGILGAVEPAFDAMVGCVQQPTHASDVWIHTLHTLDAAPIGDVVVRMAALLHDIAKPTTAVTDTSGHPAFPDHAERGAAITEAFLKRYRFSNEERVRITHLVRNHAVPDSSQWTDGDVRRFVVRIGPAALHDLIALRRADLSSRGPDRTALARFETLVARAQAVLAAREPLSTRDLAIDGSVLQQQLGLPPSRRIGEILNALLDRVLDDPTVNQREPLLAIARQLVSTN